MIEVKKEPMSVLDLTGRDEDFLNEQGFLGNEPGEDAAAILALGIDGQYAPVKGAACPNKQRRAFPGLIAAAKKKLSLRLAGTNVFTTAPNPFVNIDDPVVLIGFDRRPNFLCATAQGGVGGGQTVLDAAFSEIGDELFIVGVVNGLVVRVVPVGFPEELKKLGTDNPFGVEIEAYVESGQLSFVGYHDHHTEAYISGVYTWPFEGVPGMAPLLAGCVGTYNAGWQDARVDVLGSVTKNKLRIQGVFTLWPVAQLLRGDIPQIVGISQLSQGFMRLEADVPADGPFVHQTLQYWMDTLSGSAK